MLMVKRICEAQVGWSKLKLLQGFWDPDTMDFDWRLDWRIDQFGEAFSQHSPIFSPESAASRHFSKPSERLSWLVLRQIENQCLGLPWFDVLDVAFCWCTWTTAKSIHATLFYTVYFYIFLYISMMLTISCLACVYIYIYIYICNIWYYNIISITVSFSFLLCVVCMYNMYTTCIFGAWSWRSQGQWYCILLCSLARDPTAGWKSGQQSESNGRVNPTRSAPGAT